MAQHRLSAAIVALLLLCLSSCSALPVRSRVPAAAASFKFAEGASVGAGAAKGKVDGILRTVEEDKQKASDRLAMLQHRCDVRSAELTAEESNLSEQVHAQKLSLSELRAEAAVGGRKLAAVRASASELAKLIESKQKHLEDGAAARTAAAAAAASRHEEHSTAMAALDDIAAALRGDGEGVATSGDAALLQLSADGDSDVKNVDLLLAKMKKDMADAADVFSQQDSAAASAWAAEEKDLNAELVVLRKQRKELTDGLGGDQERWENVTAQIKQLQPALAKNKKMLAAVQEQAKMEADSCREQTAAVSAEISRKQAQLADLKLLSGAVAKHLAPPAAAVVEEEGSDGGDAAVDEDEAEDEKEKKALLQSEKELEDDVDTDSSAAVEQQPLPEDAVEG
eukprot:PLAT13681.1.p1 GENE.PLAT13681.1~~PLAT13681.1.p1  ORF type:complete len:407 (-),score=220.37 PLAT13681.1:159-1349(-)